MAAQAASAGVGAGVVAMPTARACTWYVHVPPRRSKKQIAKEVRASMASALVDLDRYNINDLESKEMVAVISGIREQMREKGWCTIKGFIRAEVGETMTNQVRDLHAWNRKWPVTAYSGKGKAPANADESHPHNRLWPQNVHAVANDLIPADAMIKVVYQDAAVKRFLARALGVAAIYEYADEFQALNIMHIREGCSRAWHYDGSDFVVTLMMQPAQKGGAFEFAPFIRGHGEIDKMQACEDEHYDDVQALFDGTYPSISFRAEPGDLALFNGQRSLHRVTEVQGPLDRIVSHLLCFSSFAHSPVAPLVCAERCALLRHAPDRRSNAWLGGTKHQAVRRPCP